MIIGGFFYEKFTNKKIKLTLEKKMKLVADNLSATNFLLFNICMVDIINLNV